MTIIEAINEADALRQNCYNVSEKLKWLSRVDAQVRKEVLDTCANPPEEAFGGYNEETDTDTRLLMPEPYSEAYVRYLEAQIDMANGELKRYNSAINEFNTIYSAFKRWHTRNHEQRKVCHRYF